MAYPENTAVSGFSAVVIAAASTANQTGERIGFGLLFSGEMLCLLLNEPLHRLESFTVNNGRVRILSVILRQNTVIEWGSFGQVIDRVVFL